MPILAYIFFLFKFILASINKKTHVKEKKSWRKWFYVAKQKKRLTILSIVLVGRDGFVRPCFSAVSVEHRSATSFRTTAFNTTLSDESKRSKRKKIWPLRHIFSFATIKANRCLVGRDGFEPSKSWTTDLQSVPFGRSGISPYFGAGERNRTINLLITNQLLCLLSYTSIVWVENRTLKRKKPQWMVLRGGIEPPTRGFSVPCSTYWATEASNPHGGIDWRPGRGSNPRPLAWQASVLTSWTTRPY